MLTRIGRVLLAVVAVIAIAIVLVRQPVLTSLPYRSKEHADARALEQHVRFLSLNRRVGAPEYIASELRASGGTVVEQPFVARKQTYRNVIATFGPDDGELRPRVEHRAAARRRDDLPGDDRLLRTRTVVELLGALAALSERRQLHRRHRRLERPPARAIREACDQRSARSQCRELHRSARNARCVRPAQLLVARLARRDARNANYHTSHDTPETLDYARMAGVVDGLFSALEHLAAPSSRA